MTDTVEPSVASHPGWDEYLRWRDDFAAILDPRFYSLEWLDGEVWSGRIRLFSSAKSAILVMLKAYPTGAIELHGMAATGELNDLLSSTIPQSENWAKGLGAICAVIESRDAWSRVMGEHGYGKYQTAIRKWLI